VKLEVQQPASPVEVDQRSFGRRRQPFKAGLFAIAALLVVLPLGLGSQSAFLAFLVNVLIFGTVALGLELVLGQAGLLSLGHAAFFGLGAYASALLTSQLSVAFPVALVAAIAIATAGALVMAPIIRLSPVYFAMASLAFGTVVDEVFNQGGSLTGGHNGLTNIPPASFAGLEVSSPVGYYYLALILCALVYVSYRAVLRSGIGAELAAIRQAEAGARSLGVRVSRLKVLALAVAAAAAGAAGSLYAASEATITPSGFSPTRSVAFLAMVVIGGKRDLWGALIGAFVIQFLITYGAGIADYQVLIYGLLLTLAMVLLPEGVSGVIKQLALRSRQKGHARA
jgi:branched-chain amino acid transport system permease protein